MHLNLCAGPRDLICVAIRVWVLAGPDPPFWHHFTTLQKYLGTATHITPKVHWTTQDSKCTLHDRAGTTAWSGGVHSSQNPGIWLRRRRYKSTYCFTVFPFKGDLALTSPAVNACQVFKPNNNATSETTRNDLWNLAAFDLLLKNWTCQEIGPFHEMTSAHLLHTTIRISVWIGKLPRKVPAAKQRSGTR